MAAQQYTDRMVALLGAMRRERNGAVADSMRFVGRAYGLNYGVSLPTVRILAREVGRDDGFARFLYSQDVRELQLAALHIADPECLTAADAAFWGAGIRNSEIAEEAAFAMLCRSSVLPEIFKLWITVENPFLQYAAIMAAARFAGTEPSWATDAIAAVDNPLPSATHAETMMVARGVAALCEAVAMKNEENRQAIVRALGSPCKSPAAEYLHEELAWRLDVSGE